MCCCLPCACIPVRLTLLLAGGYSLFQASSGIGIASTAISLYECTFFPDPDNFWFGLAYTYFFGESTKAACIAQGGESWAADTPPSEAYGIAATFPEKTNEYFIGYLTLHVLWAVASAILLLAVLCKKKRLYLIWVVVTLLICIYDLVIAGIFIGDAGVAGVKNVGTALVLPGFFSRCLIGWFINVVFLWYGFRAARFCGKKDKKSDEDSEAVQFQATTGVGIASTAISLYECNFFPDDTSLWFRLAYMYFFGASTKLECIKQGEVWALPTPPSPGYGNAATLPEKTNQYFIGYLVLHLLWAVASGIFLLAVLCKKKRLYVIWVLVTLAVCVYDLVMAGIFIADVGLAKLQSCIGIVVASLAISLYFCAPLMPTFTKEVFSDTVNNVWLKFIYVYFYGSKTMEQCYMQRNVTQPGLKLVEPYQYVLSKNSITSPESTDKYFIGYVAANVIWLAVSIIHLYATSRKKPQLYIPWIIVTLGVCLFDIALLAIYCVDLAVTVDNLVKSPNSPDWSLFTVSVLLPLYFSRGCFIGWALNLTFAVHSMQEASCCGKIEDDKVPLQQPPMSRYHDPSNREHPDLIPTLDRQHVNQQKELGNSNLYRASNAGLPQLNYYPQQQHQRAGSTSSSQPFQTGSLRYDPQKNMAGLPLVSMRNSPRLLRPEPPVEEKRYLPRATYEASEKPVKAGNKISTEGMVQLGAPHSEYQDPQPSIPSQQGDGEFRYQRPWSYLRPNQPFTKPYENHSDKLEEEEFSPVSPYEDNKKAEEGVLV